MYVEGVTRKVALRGVYAPLGSVSYPRGVYSERTLSLQMEANAVLPRLGLPILKEDGILGNKTCNAIRAIIASGSYSGWTVPNSCTVAVYDEYNPRNWWKIGVLAGAGVSLVVGGVWFFKRMIRQ